MNAKQLNHYQAKLTRLATELGEGVAQRREEVLRPLGGEGAGGFSDMPVHPSDLAVDAAEQEVETAVYENEGHLLAEVNAALARLEAGTFGICETCGRAISMKRLDALPYARQCVRCATKDETGPEGESRTG
jgi:RNA polymerase-binding protein DksA